LGQVGNLTAAVAMVLALAACGGGGGGGGFVGSTPPPPTPPPPAPTLSVSAPARATVGAGLTPVLANSATPNFTTGPAAGTEFPLLQTTVVLDPTSIAPDTAVNAAGGTVTAQPGALTLSIDGHDVALARQSLDWTLAGPWSTDIPEGPWDYGGDLSKRGAFVAGYETPANAMPTTGSATYTGFADGRMYVPLSFTDALPCRCQEVPVQGDALLEADFGARTVRGELTNMVRIWWDESAWNHVTFTSTIAGNGFNGTTRVTAGAELGMAGNATGTIDGKFFGTAAQEAGAVWTLFDGTNAAIGTLTGKRP
jgi:hypothetical protein